MKNKSESIDKIPEKDQSPNKVKNGTDEMEIVVEKMVFIKSIFLIERQ